MYEESILFGPLSLKQFVTLAIGVILIYFVNKYSDNYIIIGAIGAATLFLVFQRFQNKKIPIDELEFYFKQKKFEMPQEDYDKMIEIKIAELESQMEARREKGLFVDENIDKILNIVKGFKRVE